MSPRERTTAPFLRRVLTLSAQFPRIRTCSGQINLYRGEPRGELNVFTPRPGALAHISAWHAMGLACASSCCSHTKPAPTALALEVHRFNACPENSKVKQANGPNSTHVLKNEAVGTKAPHVRWNCGTKRTAQSQRSIGIRTCSQGLAEVNGPEPVTCAVDEDSRPRATACPEN